MSGENMAINKIEKHQREIPYEMLSRETITSIENPVALAVWVHLVAKPQDWVVRRNEIKERFKIGDIAYKKAIDELKSLGLFVVERVRDDKGHIVENLIHIYPNIDKTRNSDNPYCGKPVIRETNKLTEKEIITENDIIKEKERGQKRKRFVAPHLNEVLAHCHNETEAIKFVSHYESNGWMVGRNKMVDWKAALRGWMKRAETYANGNNNMQTYEQRINDIDW